MIWKVLHGIVDLLCGVVPAWMFIRNADDQRAATVLSDGRVEFTPNKSAYWAWPFIVTIFIWSAVRQLLHTQGKPTELLLTAGTGLVALMFLFSFPGTIVVSSDGLEQVYWLRRHKRIKWDDIVEINTGEKTGNISITGVDGTEITYDGRVADRPRLLLELKQHCGDNLPPDFPRES